MAQPLQHQPQQMQQSQQHPKAHERHVAPAVHKVARKLGRKPRGHDPRVPHLSARLRGIEPAIPSSVNWRNGMPAFLGYMLNGGDNTLVPGGQALGDCPIAGLHHGRQIWTFNSGGGVITDPDKDVIKDYEVLCGYVLGDESTDQGGVLQDVLSKAAKVGLTTEAGPDKPIDFYEVDPRNLDDVRRVVWECGFAYVGIDIPESWTEASDGDIWDATDSPIAGGHCVLLHGYDKGAGTFAVTSWGMSFVLTEAGFRQACDEGYAVIDGAWLKATGKSPAGLTEAQIAADMSAVRAG